MIEVTNKIKHLTEILSTSRLLKEKEKSCFLHSKLKEILKIYGIDKQGLLFGSQRGRKYNKRTIQQIVKNAAKKTEIKKKVTHHLFP